EESGLPLNSGHIAASQRTDVEGHFPTQECQIIMLRRARRGKALGLIPVGGGSSQAAFAYWRRYGNAGRGHRTAASRWTTACPSTSLTVSLAAATTVEVRAS